MKIKRLLLVAAAAALAAGAANAGPSRSNYQPNYPDASAYCHKLDTYQWIGGRLVRVRHRSCPS